MTTVAYVRMSIGLAGAATLALMACGGDDGGSDDGGGGAQVASTTTVAAAQVTEGGNIEQRYPDVIAAEAEFVGDAWTFSATISSPYDTPQRYADAWRVVAPDGTVLGVRELAHDHAGEQPFTRTLAGVAVPLDVDRVTLEGRDLANGWGGATVEIELSRR
jgi:hypothetical protein